MNLNKFKHIIKSIIRYALSPFVLSDYIKFKLRDSSKRFNISFKNIYPSIKDKTITTGFDRHYVFQTAWAVRKVKEINPSVHTDISSTLFFCGTLSAFIPVEFYDIRPAAVNLDNLESKKGDLLNLPFPSNAVQSLSCMHTIEHIGLGRYGDPIDADGDIKAIKELIRVLKPGGHLLFVTPIGKEMMIEFNAHRIYTYEYIIELFKELNLKEFSYIYEHEKDGGIVFNADPTLSKKDHYGCGCFHFTKSA